MVGLGDDPGKLSMPGCCASLANKSARKGSAVLVAGVSSLSYFILSLFLSILSRSNFDHHLRCGGWLNFEFS